MFSFAVQTTSKEKLQYFQNFLISLLHWELDSDVMLLGCLPAAAHGMQHWG